MSKTKSISDFASDILKKLSDSNNFNTGKELHELLLSSKEIETLNNISQKSKFLHQTTAALFNICDEQLKEIRRNYINLPEDFRKSKPCILFFESAIKSQLRAFSDSLNAIEKIHTDIMENN